MHASKAMIDPFLAKAFNSWFIRCFHVVSLFMVMGIVIVIGSIHEHEQKGICRIELILEFIKNISATD